MEVLEDGLEDMMQTGTRVSEQLIITVRGDGLLIMNLTKECLGMERPAYLQILIHSE